MFESDLREEVRVASIGECMVEFRRAADGRFDLAYGGDTFNTAVYLQRLGVRTDFVTVLGDDPFSAGIEELCRAERVGTDLVGHLPERCAGLYVIETDDAGERRFHYWRDRSPVREMFDLPFGSRVTDALPGYGLIYLSGITLSLFSDRALDALLAGVDSARSAGCQVAFDGNFRPAGWPDLDRARRVFGRMLERTDVGLPTFDDERNLFGDATISETIDRYRAAGVREIVVKDGACGCTISVDGELALVEANLVPRPVDTTAAGDSFNAGYLASRLKGGHIADAARLGHRLAAIVIQHPGAIIPAVVMTEQGLLEASIASEAAK